MKTKVIFLINPHLKLLLLDNICQVIDWEVNPHGNKNLIKHYLKSTLTEITGITIITEINYKNDQNGFHSYWTQSM